MNAGITSPEADLLYGLPSIARYLGLKVTQARHLADTKAVPTFKVGRLVSARKSTLQAWMKELEEGARNHDD